jgi:hypothetical protein
MRPIGVVVPELSVIVALTPPKVVGKGAGGPAVAAKTAVSMLAAYRLTTESGAAGAAPLAAETVVTVAAEALATMFVVSPAAVAVAPTAVKVTRLIAWEGPTCATFTATVIAG